MCQFLPDFFAIKVEHKLLLPIISTFNLHVKENLSCQTFGIRICFEDTGALRHKSNAINVDFCARSPSKYALNLAEPT